MPGNWAARFAVLTVGVGVPLPGRIALARPGAPDLYRIAPVAVDLRAGDSVGPKRSGSLCLPAGSIAWRDAKPDDGEARAALAAGLRAGGLAVVDPDNPFGDAASADRVIRTRVRGIRLSACGPPGGLGRLMNRSYAIHGDGLIAVEWRTYARGQDEPVMTGRSCVAFTYQEHEGALVRMTLAGLRAAGGEEATALRGRPVAPSDHDDPCRHVWGDRPDVAP